MRHFVSKRVIWRRDGRFPNRPYTGNAVHPVGAGLKPALSSSLSFEARLPHPVIPRSTGPVIPRSASPVLSF